jgi:hypothetical protein
MHRAMGLLISFTILVFLFLLVPLNVIHYIGYAATGWLVSDIVNMIVDGRT